MSQAPATWKNALAHSSPRAFFDKERARALSRAETTLDRADRSADPQWIGYFDEAYLSAKFGHCFKVLNDHERTERFARRSLDMNDRYVRGRQFNLALLGSALVGRGEIEEAAEVTAKAQALAMSLKSRRAETYIDELRTGLRPYVDEPAVRSALDMESAENTSHGSGADDLTSRVHADLHTSQGNLMESLLPGWRERSEQHAHDAHESLEQAVRKADADLARVLAAPVKAQLAEHWTNLGGGVPD